MSTKKILIIDEFYHPMVGGIQIRTKGFAKQWLTDGHEIFAYVLDHVGSLPTNEIIDGVDVTRVHRDKNYYRGGKFGRKISTIFIFTFKLWFKLLFKLNQFDIVIFNQFPLLPAIVLNRLWYFKSKKPTIVLDFVEFRQGAFWKIIQSLLFKSVDKVICISEYIKQQAVKYNKSSIVIPNSISVKSYDPGFPLKKDYIFIGRMEFHKHPEHAIEAVLLFNKKYNRQSKLHLVGDGVLYNSLKTQYHSETVIFHGFINDNEKIQLLKTCNILLLPSEREGLPTVVIEAMASGVPVVTTDYPNNGTKHFVIDEKVGIVAEPFPENIADCLFKIEENIEQYRNNCIKALPKYTVEKNSRLFIEFCLS